MQNIECAICSEQFRICEAISSTPCGHIYHECCISKWLSGSPTNTCPECREIMTINDLRRAYFNFAPSIDNMQTYIEDLKTEIISTANKYQRVKLENMELKNDVSNQLKEKDNEIMKLREKHSEMKEKLNENHKLQELVRELQRELHTHQHDRKMKKAQRVRSKCATEQMYPWPVDMSVHNPHAMQSAMQAAMYHQNQPSTSATMHMDNSMQAASSVLNKSATYTSNEGSAIPFRSSTERSSAHSSRSVYPSGGDMDFLLQQRLAMPSPLQMVMNQSSMMPQNYLPWTMPNGNSSMMMPTNDTAPHQNLNYQQYMQQSQPQQHDMDSTNVNLPYMNGSNNMFSGM